LRLTPDRSEIQADGKDLSFVLIEAVDKDGNVCPLADNRIEIKTEGGVAIAGIDNGNPQSLNPFQSNSVSLFYGKAMLIIKSSVKSETAKISAESKGLKPAETTLKIQ